MEPLNVTYEVILSNTLTSGERSTKTTVGVPGRQRVELGPRHSSSVGKSLKELGMPGYFDQ